MITAADHGKAQEPLLPQPVTIASLDAASLDHLAPPDAAEKRPAWRTTFGSERRSGPPVTAPKGAVDADVVLLHGLTRLRPVRLQFPAKAWKLVISRQMLAAEPGAAADGPGAGRPVTAVAVRLRQGLRVTAQEHLLALAAPATAGTADRGAAATAVRVQAGSSVVWAVAVDLDPSSCPADEPKCKEPKALADWRGKKLEAGETVVVGGRVDIGGDALLPPPPCPGLALVARRPGPDEVAHRISARTDDAVGCIARTTVGSGG